MANIKSAVKRIQVSKRNTIRNRVYKSLIKTFTKSYLTQLSEYKTNPTLENFKQLEQRLSKVTSALDKAVKTNVIHRNKASRKKSQLSLQLNSARALLA